LGRRHRHRPALQVEALKAKRLNEIRIEISSVPTPFNEEKLNFTVSMGGWYAKTPRIFARFSPRKPSGTTFVGWGFNDVFYLTRKF